MWCNGAVKDAVERKEAAWEEVLGVMDKTMKKRCMEVYKKKYILKGVYKGS